MTAENTNTAAPQPQNRPPPPAYDTDHATQPPPPPKATDASAETETPQEPATPVMAVPLSKMVHDEVSVQDSSLMAPLPVGGEVTFEGEGEEQEISKDEAAKGAAAVGAVAGFLCGGVVLGAVCGAGSFYAAKQDSNIGDKFRSAGKVAVKGYRKTSQFCQQNNVGGKVQKVCTNAYKSAKGFNEKHQITRTVSSKFMSGLNRLSGDDKKSNNEPTTPPAETRTGNNKENTPPPQTPSPLALAGATATTPVLSSAALAQV